MTADIFVSATAQCPSGYIHHDQSCYVIPMAEGSWADGMVSSDVKHLHWYNQLQQLIRATCLCAYLWRISLCVQTLCRQLGGQLAVIETAAEQTFVEGLLKRYGGQSLRIQPTVWEISLLLHGGSFSVFSLSVSFSNLLCLSSSRTLCSSTTGIQEAICGSNCQGIVRSVV